MSLRSSVRSGVYSTLGRSGGAARLALRIRSAAAHTVARRLVAGQAIDADGERRLLAVVGPEVTTAVDVGANTGLWAREALASCPRLERLVCYEPARVAGDSLEAEMGADPRVTVIRAAVGDKASRLTLYEQPGGAQTSSVLPQVHRDVTRAEVTPLDVPVVTVDDELIRLGIERVDFLKIDVEGFDLHVLRGARSALARGAISMVQFEYNRPWMFAGSTLQAAAHLLRDHGYDLFLLSQDGIHDCDVARLGELFVYLNFVAMPPDQLERFRLTVLPDPLGGG